LEFFALISGSVASIGLADRDPELVIHVEIGLVDPREDPLPGQPLAPLNTRLGHA